MSGSKNRSAEDWKLIRRTQRAYPLAGRVCEVCQADKDLQRHHRNRNREDNSKKNVAIRCGKHHRQAHKRRGDWPNQ